MTLAAVAAARVAQQRLGHSTTTKTRDVYSHVTATMQEDAAAQFDAALRSAIKTIGGLGGGGSVANVVASTRFGLRGS
jgi:hypothetical protein